VRVAANGPSWLVLGESYDPGWRARCDGRDLGAPRPMQGYANAWPVAGGCRSASFAYGPQRLAVAGYALSGAGCLALLVLLLAGRARALAAARRTAPPGALPAAPARPARLAPRRAALVALAAAIVLGFCFGLRAGVVLGPLLGLALWRGAGDGLLLKASAALLAIGVPLAYAFVALFGPRNPGGYDTSYATDRIAGHWLALAGLTALGLVLWRTLAAARPGRPRAPEPEPPPADALSEPLGSALVTTSAPRR
jgi:arabinofuranan 3-O-arabinosyltransferase